MLFTVFEYLMVMNDVIDIVLDRLETEYRIESSDLTDYPRYSISTRDYSSVILSF